MNGDDGVPGAKTYLTTTDFCEFFFFFYTVFIIKAEFCNPFGYLWPHMRSLV